MSNQNEVHLAWAKEVFTKMEQKLEAECARMGDKIPYVPQNGVYPDHGAADLSFWTNGFWGGILWQLYKSTDKEIYREAAQRLENRLDRAMAEFMGLHHDVGFMWLHTSVANYRLTKDPISYARGMHAASLLLGRYNPNGNYLSAWNENRPGWMIVDSMMNLPLLYWATRESGDPRYEAVARRHIETVLRVLIRPDGSAHHIAVLDEFTGEILDHPVGQGYASGSSWSRGQAWAIYGFALAYRYLGESNMLNTAKTLAHYFIANVSQTGDIPMVDFRSDLDDGRRDTTAAMCAACGMLEISEHVPAQEATLYREAAMRILKASVERFADWDISRDGILGGGTEAYHREHNNNVPIIYGDYFMLEAATRLLNNGFLIW